MPEKNLPFFEMFSPYQPDPALYGVLESWLVTGAVLDSAARTIEVQLLCPVPPDGALLRRVEGDLAQLYSLSRAVLAPMAPEPAVCCAQERSEPDEEPPFVFDDAPPPEEPPFSFDDVPPAPEESPAPAEPQMSEQERIFRQTEALRQRAMKEAMAAHAAEKVFSANRIFGNRQIKKKPVPMNTLELDMGIVVVEGDVFAVEHRELKKRNAWVISFDITDYTSSIRVNSFMPGDEGLPIVNGVKTGQHLKISGRLNLNRFDNDMVLEPMIIETAEKKIKKDNAPEKRVELHLHTRMSLMDALTETKDAVKRAISWGHPAIAITDHGVAQSFPDAWSAAKGKIKALLGTEAYYINDVDEKLTVRGDQDQDLDGPIVCFDLETTGLDRHSDVITEIGAVVLEKGEVKEKFQTFVDPQRPLAPNIVQLTGITDEMLIGAPSQEEALRDFLAFVDGRPLAAHNAEFDIGFVREGCRRYGIPFAPTCLDTLPLAQNLLPELGKYKLDIVCRHLNLPDFNHHRASDDAAMVGHMLVPFIQMLRDRGADKLQQVNGNLAKTSSLGKAKRMPKHLIVLAKNQTGLRNLYKLISLGHLQYFKRFPIMPKSEINANREGLILGSACEAGELYQAIVRGKDWEELCRIASWYDYLEIQPLSNNAFMLRPDKNGKSIARDWEQIREWNRMVVRLGEELGKPVCATGDVHFLDPEDEAYRHVLLDTKGFDDADAPNPLYFRTTEEMLEEFAYLGEEAAYRAVVSVPNEIADSIEEIRPIPEGYFGPSLDGAEEEIEKKCRGRLNELYGESVPDAVEERLTWELAAIRKRNAAIPMAISEKLVNTSKANGYMVTSRGCVAASFVAYLLGITNIDPFEYDLPAETFFGLDGSKWPDIDLNFADEYQPKVREQLEVMFGKEHVLLAGTIGTIAWRRAWEMLVCYCGEDYYSRPKDEREAIISSLSGVKCSAGHHPHGYVIIPQDMEAEDFCPLDYARGEIITHFEFYPMEECLEKLDLLSISALTVLHELEKETGIKANSISLNDEETLKLVKTLDTIGLWDSGSMFNRKVMEVAKPESLKDLIRVSGLTHGTGVWIDNAEDLLKEGTMRLEDTIAFRDDVFHAALAHGMNREDAYNLMEFIRKGKMYSGPDAWGGEKRKRERDHWEAVMRQYGFAEWYIASAKKIEYLFPKAHSTHYAILDFWLLWYKAHKPEAFYAAMIRERLRNETLNIEDLDRTLEDIQEEMENYTASYGEDWHGYPENRYSLELLHEAKKRGIPLNAE